MSETTDKLDTWGIVEVMGHKKFAGRISEHVIASSALVRVDVPAVTVGEGKTVPEFSKLIGVGSIYCITPTTEAVARKAAAVLAKYESDPLPVYIPEERQLAAPVTADDEDDDDLWNTREGDVSRDEMYGGPG